jgi:hypothetical protein
MKVAESKGESDESDTQIFQPTYFLQRKLGGPASQMLNPLSVKRAEVALIKVMPPVDHEVKRLLGELQIAVSSGNPHVRDLIWSHAHDIRGLAGSATKVRLGQAADIMCRYLQGTDPDFLPDRKVLSTIAVVALLAVKEGADDDPMVSKLLGDSVLAVDAQRHREGRPPAD